MRKIRIAVLFGGRSGEHDVSIRSAASVLQALDREKYDVIPVAITREGRWLRPGESARLLPAGARESLSIETEAVLSKEPGVASGVEVVFPVLHGSFGEDGTIQGLLELADVAYVGAGVLSSAVGMDKDVMKRLFRERGLATVDHLAVLRSKRAASIPELEGRFGYPMFVKPANLGSSVGISKANDRDGLRKALDLAAEFDRKLIVEPAIRGREIECSVLGNDDPQASVPGEIKPGSEFYNYEAKYIDDSSELLIPAPLTGQQMAEVQRMSVGAFQAIEGSGLARVDFFLEDGTGRILLNEINTMPGFTSISMYSKLWEASGVAYAELVDRLIQLASERNGEKRQTRFSRND